MILQMKPAEIGDTLSVAKENPEDWFIYFIFGITVLTLLYFLFRKFTKQKVQLANELTKPLNTSSDVKIAINNIKENIAPKTVTPEQINEITSSFPLTEPNPIPEIIKPAIEEQSKEKYIGYNPINIFAQTEPLHYPYVIMPKPNSVIKFPRKGRVGRKGYKEEDFRKYIDTYFRNGFQIFDDRFILVKNNNLPFEPDFTLIDEKQDVNLFIDIEIDEPYEGLNDLVRRKTTHYQYADVNRNNAFKSRGWIVIRFAEIQVHQNPVSCCRFIADVINSIHPSFVFPESLKNSKQINPIKQWTKEEAETWSTERYREKYLGILRFGVTSENDAIEDLSETELDEKIEEKVIEEPKFIPTILPAFKSKNPKFDLIINTIKSNKYLSFIYQGKTTIVRPVKSTENSLTAFCYVKNIERVFNINEISNLLLKNNYYTLRVAGPTIGLDKITTAVNTSINYKKYVRMKYTRSAWTSMRVDIITGELIQNRIEAEESIRTINNVQLSINALAQEHIIAYNLDNNHITAYCNKREEQRTFRFDRIGEVEILDI